MNIIFHLLLTILVLGSPLKTWALIDYFITSNFPQSIRYGCFQSVGPPKGTIVILHGRREVMEQYTEVIEVLKNAGYTVWSMDWRGQGGSCKNKLYPSSCGHVDSYDLYIKDLAEFLHTIVDLNATNKAHLIAHSMGGHIALRYMIECPSPPIDRLILYSPMIDIITPMNYDVSRRCAQFVCAMGLGTFTFKDGFTDQRFEHNLLTNDWTRWLDHMQKYANFDVPGYSYQWISETFKSIDLIHRYTPEQFDRLQSPVLLLSGGQEKVVPIESLDWLFSKINQDCVRKRHIHYLNAKHCILREVDEIYKRAMRDILIFLEDPMPLQPS